MLAQEKVGKEKGTPEAAYSLRYSPAEGVDIQRLLRWMPTRRVLAAPLRAVPSPGCVARRGLREGERQTKVLLPTTVPPDVHQLTPLFLSTQYLPRNNAGRAWNELMTAPNSLGGLNITGGGSSLSTPLLR